MWTTRTQWEILLASPVLLCVADHLRSLNDWVKLFKNVENIMEHFCLKIFQENTLNIRHALKKSYKKSKNSSCEARVGVPLHWWACFNSILHNLVLHERTERLPPPVLQFPVQKTGPTRKNIGLANTKKKRHGFMQKWSLHDRITKMLKITLIFIYGSRERALSEIEYGSRKRGLKKIWRDSATKASPNLQATPLSPVDLWVKPEKIQTSAGWKEKWDR